MLINVYVWVMAAISDWTTGYGSLRKSPFMWVVYHKLELSQIPKIKEYIYF